MWVYREVESLCKLLTANKDDDDDDDDDDETFI